MLTIESLKAKQISGNPETDIHATVCQKQLHILFGILGVLVTQWNLGVNFCIILGALHLPIMNVRTSRMKPHRDERPHGKKALWLPSEGLISVNAACLQLWKKRTAWQKQGFTSKELLSLDQISSTIQSPRKEFFFYFYGFATSYILSRGSLSVWKCSTISKTLHINTRHDYQTF